ncbi:acyl-CoA thioesterase [Nocardioides cynanchi]|uniref:acyl-CoA thioesterase n=1 Tax=Nocardioides cynanchi TaxID=2558918 RepID=UPI001EE199A4|nr:acyl-CoA thioesterase [Nocardioides cynanchi]
MTEVPTRSPRPTRADFVHWSTATTRWADLDGFGHMNNATYFELIDTAIDLHLQEAIGGAADSIDTIGVFAEVSCRFFREVGYPAPVDLGVRVDRVGRTSVSYRVGLFQGDDDDAAAEGRVVVVYVDNTDPARPATPLPAAIRAAVEALMR